MLYVMCCSCFSYGKPFITISTALFITFSKNCISVFRFRTMSISCQINTYNINNKSSKLMSSPVKTLIKAKIALAEIFNLPEVYLGLYYPTLE